jgi:hypothetical protein
VYKFLTKTSKPIEFIVKSIASAAIYENGQKTDKIQQNSAGKSLFKAQIEFELDSEISTGVLLTEHELKSGFKNHYLIQEGSTLEISPASEYSLRFKFFDAIVTGAKQ